MEQNKRKVFKVDEAYLWLEQESSVHLKAVSKFGDPIELTFDEALELAKVLEELAIKLRLQLNYVRYESTAIIKPEGTINIMKAMQEITIEVSSEIAEAYQSASPKDRRRIQAIVSILLQKQSNADIAFLQELMDEISDRAEARGLTPEILESILSER